MKNEKLTYGQKVVKALRDDEKGSLSFKDPSCLNNSELQDILAIAEPYSDWLQAVKAEAARRKGVLR